MGRISHIKDTSGTSHILPTQVIEGRLYNELSLGAGLLIPNDIVFEDGINYIIHVNTSSLSSSNSDIHIYYQLVDKEYQSASYIYYHFISGLTYTPDGGFFGDRQYLYQFNGGSRKETVEIDGVTWWRSDYMISLPSTRFLDSNKLDKTGDKLQTIANQTEFEADSTSYGIDMRNSTLANVNAINFNDTCDYNSEGIHFKRTNGNWDTLLGLDGTLKFIQNRSNNASDGTTNNIAFCAGSIRIAAGTKVISVPAAQKYVQIFTNAELNTALGISTGAGQGSTVVYGMNGDYGAQGKYLSGAVYQNGNWFLQTNDGTNLSKGPIRINYIVIKFA